MKILIVDDNDDNIVLEKTILKSCGYTIATAADGVHALEVASQFCPDMIISDILMPRMDGFELCRTVKANEQLKKVPFIIYSASFTGSEDKTLAKALGASTFIEKPIDPEEFVKIIKKLVDDYEEGKITIPDDSKVDRKKLSQIHENILVNKLSEKVNELENEISKRKETELEIKKQRDFLYNVFESIPDPFYVINANDFTIKMANSALNAGDLSKNITCHELTHKSSIPCDGINNICPLEEVKSTGQSVTREHLHYDVNGKQKYVQIHAYPIFNDKGDIIKMIEYTRDITDIKISETSLKESEERYRSLIEAISTVIWTADSSGGFATPQLSWEKYTGQPWSEHKDYGWTKMIRPDGVERILKVWEKANREMSLYETWGHIWNENLKEWRDFEVRAVPVKNADGSLREWIGVITDITERKKAEETVQTLSQAIEQSTASIVITDIEGNIIYVNSKFCSLTEYDRMEVIGQNPRILKSGETSDAEYVEIWKTLTSGSSWTGMLHNKKKSGELYWEQAVISPVWNDKGEIIQFLAIKEDVTDRIKAESEIKHLASFPQLNVNPILEVDYAGNIVFNNIAAMEIIDQLDAKCDLNLFVPHNITEIIETLKEVENEQYYCEVEIGNLIFGENIHLVQDFNVLRIYARNITDEKDMADKLTVSYKMASLGRLTAGVFHEILNPINIISSHIQLLLMEAEHGSQTEEDLKSVQEEIVRVTKITDSLLRFSRKEGSDSTQVEINDLLERSISIVEP
ncbi:MAG: PAS domain S-box protein, partial [Candidatus Scalindua sp.]|nr:PAS domain S-box protein [Candidatus Scalindua sp.]